MKYPEYKFVDLAIGGVEKRNNIVEIDQIEELIQQKRYECYATFFRFPIDLKYYVGKNKSVAGYKGKAFADFLPLDIDVEENDLEESLVEALKRARWVVAVLIEEFNLKGEYLKYFFSGKKGFHILIPSSVFNCKPFNQISIVFKRMAGLIADKTNINLDERIYDLVRLFRLPNTKHKISGLYKIPLSYKEFNNIDSKQILFLAKTPRKLKFSEDQEIVSDVLCQNYLRFTDDLNEPLHQSTSPVKKYQMPLQSKICYYRIMEGVEVGMRDECGLRLAVYFKKLGYPSNIALGALSGWNERNNPSLNPRVIEQKIEQAYNNNYHFGCNDSILKMLCDLNCYLIKEKEKQSEDVKSIEELVIEYKNYVSQLTKNSIHLGFGKIDEAMRCIAPGEVCELIGLPTSGKTCIAINVLRNISINQKIPCLFFSLEQPSAQIFERAMSMSTDMTGVEVEREVKTGRIEYYLSHVLKDFHNIYVCDKSNLALRDMKDYITMLQDRIDRKVRFVVIDYLGLVGGVFGSSYEIITALSRQIKNFAKEMQLAILFLHHVSVKKKSVKDPLDLSDARDSSVAVDATDFLLGMWRPEPNRIVVKLMKSRKSDVKVEYFRFIPDKMIIQLESSSVE